MCGLGRHGHGLGSRAEDRTLYSASSMQNERKGAVKCTRLSLEFVSRKYSSRIMDVRRRPQRSWRTHRPALRAPRHDALCFEITEKAYIFGGKFKAPPLFISIQQGSINILTMSHLHRSATRAERLADRQAVSAASVGVPRACRP